MSYRDSIENSNRYSNSSYLSDTKLLASLNELRKKNEKDFDAFAKELNRKRLEGQIDEEKKFLNKRLALAELYEKQAEKKRKKLDDQQFQKWKDREKKKLNKQLDMYKAYLKDKEKEDRRQALTEVRDYYAGKLTGKGVSIKDRVHAAKELGFGGTLDTLISGLSTLSRQLDNTIDTIAGYQSKIDTRLLGSGKRWEGRKGIAQTLSGIAGVSPWIQTKKLYENVDKLAEKGISFNLEQRAFLETMAEKIATTLHVDNQNLLNLIRVQQADTTAARLGLEANLNSYFNSMFATTEYLSDAFDNVSSSIYEAVSQMNAVSGVGFEYQVQKWLGSLYSVGMSQGAVSSIASALGMLGSGNITGLAGSSGMQNLLVMAASRAGLPYSSLLTSGLTAENTNKLLAAMVGYLAQIADTTKDNRVVRSQYANIFGLSVSDITAMANLAPSIKQLLGSNLDYGGAMQSLTNTANTIWKRTSIGEMMSNVWSNVQYQMATGVASNPALYGIWKVANALTDLVGGIALPDIKYMGTGVNLQTTVADLMRVGALSTGLMGGIGNIMMAGSGGGFIPSMMLKALGLAGDKISVVTRGGEVTDLATGLKVSQVGYIGNTAGSEIYESSLLSAEEEQEQKLAQVKEEHEDEVTTETINSNVVQIYELLSSVISSGHLNVALDEFPSGSFTN